MAQKIGPTYQLRLFRKFHEKPSKDRGGHVSSLQNLCKPQKPPFSFLYINPYDTGSILKKSKKSALFGIPFCKNFLIGTNFRSKPRLKKIVNRGGVVQVAKKRAPQGKKHRNFTTPLA